MAKDLPWFKFNTSEWSDGDITLEDYEVQGVFVNICCYYWSKECDLTLTKIKRRFKDAKPNAFISLTENGIVKHNKETDAITINFLDEQLKERLRKSKVNSSNGKKGGRPRKSDVASDTDESETKAFGFNSESETKAKQKAIRGEERREEEKRKENTNTFNFKKYLIELGVEDQIASDWLKVRAKKRASNTETAFNKIKKEIEKSKISANECIKIAVEKNWMGFESIYLNSNNYETGHKQTTFKLSESIAKKTREQDFKTSFD